MKFCGVDWQQRSAMATNGGVDGDWHEAQRPEARGPVVLRAAAAAAMVAGDGDRGGGGGDGGGGEGGGGRLCVQICVGIGVGIHIGIGIHCIVDVSLVRSSHWPAAAGERQQLLHL